MGRRASVGRRCQRARVVPAMRRILLDGRNVDDASGVRSVIALLTFGSSRRGA